MMANQQQQDRFPFGFFHARIRELARVGKPFTPSMVSEERRGTARRMCSQLMRWGELRRVVAGRPGRFGPRQESVYVAAKLRESRKFRRNGGQQ